MNRLFYFNINYNCNSDCIFCAADHGLAKEQSMVSFKDYCAEFEKQGIGEGDRVVINGGEPTIHPEFIRFLRKAREEGCFIDLYTNGIKSSDPEFMEQVVENAPMLIRIPVFGATDSKHDMLTGHIGSFDKIMQAFKNLSLYDLTMDNLYIEVKLLLSKATIEENLKIISLFENEFPGRFYFSLNPLISSEKVKLNSKLLVESLSSLVQKSEPVIDFALKKEKQIDINLLPFCLIPERFRHLVNIPDRQVLEEYYSDPYQFEQTIKDKFETIKCTDCYYRVGCKGFPPYYFTVFDSSEVLPFAESFSIS